MSAVVGGEAESMVSLDDGAPAAGSPLVGAGARVPWGLWVMWGRVTWPVLWPWQLLWLMAQSQASWQALSMSCSSLPAMRSNSASHLVAQSTRVMRGSEARMALTSALMRTEISGA